MVWIGTFARDITIEYWGYFASKEICYPTGAIISKFYLKVSIVQTFEIFESSIEN